jgi:hypothetical protein
MAYSKRAMLWHKEIKKPEKEELVMFVDLSLFGEMFIPLP